MSSLTLEGIERELQLINANLAEANDIALLAVFKPLPPELDNDSRKALSAIRDNVMKRARDRVNA